MLIPLESLPEMVIPRFHGGEGEAHARAYNDTHNRIMLGRLAPGASIGRHVHEDSSEIVYVLQGTGTAWTDGEAEPLRPGACHYCPMGHAHEMTNDGDEDLVIFTVVPSHAGNA